MIEASDAAPVRKIRWLVVLAAVIALLLAIGAVIAIGDEVLSAQAIEGHGLYYDQWVEVAVGAATGLLAGFLVWLNFYLWLFRRRAKPWKARVALPVIALIAAVVAIPARIITVVVHVEADDVAVAQLRDAGIERRRAIRAELVPNIDGLRMDQGMPYIENVAGLVAHKAAIDAARTQLQIYRSAMVEDLAASRAALEEMDIHPDARFRGYAYYDERLSPASNTQRHLDLTDRILLRGSELLDNLLAHRSGWVIQDGRVVFVDQALYEETQQRGHELDQLGALLDNVQGAMGRGLDGSPLLGADGDEGPAN